MPRWRGAAPIQRAIMEGDNETGVCIMKMDEELDTGPILSSNKIQIKESEGEIIKIGLSKTIAITEKGSKIFIPNQKFNSRNQGFKRCLSCFVGTNGQCTEGISVVAAMNRHDLLATCAAACEF